MTKLKVGVIFMVIMLLTVFYACKKNDKNDESVSLSITEKINSLSKEFLTDTTFYTFATTLITNSLKQAKIAKQLESARTSADSSLIRNLAAENLTAMYFLEENHPNFETLTIEQKQQVFNNIGDSLASVSYRAANSNNPLIIFEQNTLPVLSSIDNIAVLSRLPWSTSNITTTEFWVCTTGLIGAALGNYGSIVKDLKWLLQNGSASWGAVLSLAKDLVVNACPWWKVAGMAIAYGGCLYNAGTN